MPYQRPDWASTVRAKYNDLVPTLGGAERYAQAYDEGGAPLKSFPTPGSVRRDMPDVSIPGPAFPETGKKISLSRSNKVGSASRTFNVTGATNKGATLLNSGKTTLRDVGNVLEKTDPSQVIGAIKGTVKETAKSGARYFGAVGLASQVVTDKLFQKLLLKGRLSKEEMDQLDSRMSKDYVRQLELMGFDLTGTDEEVNERFRKQVGSDAFNVAAAVATLAPIVSASVTAAKTIFKGGKPLLSVMANGFSKTAVREAIGGKVTKSLVDRGGKKIVTEVIEKAGSPLIVDVAGNVFAKSTTKSAVKFVFSEGAKDVLKFSNNIIKPLSVEIYKQGMTMELINEARKYVDAESALRIERDQRKFVEDLSLGERLFLDLAVGYWLPFEIPGLKTTYRMLEEAGDGVSLAAASRAVDKMFSDDKSIEVLNRLAQFQDVAKGTPLDVGVKGTLMHHLLTVMDEDKAAKTVEHLTERMLSWANDPSVAFLNKRRDIENIATNLSWYSEKLGRPLEPHERLMHWFVTSMKGSYVGDLGEGLADEFENALKLATSGIPAGKEQVLRIIERSQDVKELTGRVIKAGDAKLARQAIDVGLNDKADLLIALRERLRGFGSDLIIKEGKVIVPDAFKDMPEIRSIIDDLAMLQRGISDAVAEARAIGVPDNLLSLPSNKWLLDTRDAFDKYQSIIGQAETSQQLRAFLQNVTDSDIAKLKSYIARNPEGRDKILTGQLKGYTKIITDATELRGTVLAADATDDQILDFLLGLPTKSDASVKVPREVSRVLNKMEKEALQMNEAISNFDRQLLEVTRKSVELGIKGDVPFTQAIKEVVTEMRDIEAQLPRGMFAPEFLAKDSRWGAGVTPIPLDVISESKIPGWAEAFVKLQDANGVTRTLTDYMVPHNPSDLYVKAQNKLFNLLEEQAPGKAEAIVKEIAKVQDRGISMIPVMPGGGPKWEALGKPMISGVDWKTLDDIGKRFGVEGLGKMSREAFVNTMRESGIKPGIVDRLRAAPGIGAMYDALYRQYMLTRFAINPLFHAQQLPETALVGVLRSFNLPTDMSKAYLSSVTRSPLKSFDEAESALYRALYEPKIEKTVADGMENIAVIRETQSGTDLLKATTIEERKRLAAFMAEFPVKVRGELFNFPALKNVDPLALEEYRSFILDLQGNPAKMAEAIEQSFSTKGYDLKMEAVKRAVKSTQTEVQKLVSYNLNRSALEKDVHAILFPFSFLKKFWSEVGNFATGGSVLRPGAVGEVMQGVSDFNESPTMIETRAKYPTMTGWIWGLTPINPTYPVVDIEHGSLGFGGLRATPVQAVLWDTFVDPDGKYDVTEDPEASVRKLGGGGASFYLRDLPSFYGEIFRGDSPEQQRKYIYTLNRLQMEARSKDVIK